MNRLFGTTTVEINGVRTVAGGGTGVSSLAPYSAEALTGTGVTFDSNNGPFQKSSVTGAATLNAPSNGTEGKTLKLWLNAATSDRALTIHSSILIPTDSGFTSPKTLTATKTYIVMLQYNGTAWMLTSFVGGF